MKISNKQYNVISLDLFNTLVYVDRSSYDLHKIMRNVIPNITDYDNKLSHIPLDDSIELYRIKIRERMSNREIETEFSNDQILIEIWEEYGLEITEEIKDIAYRIIEAYFESVLCIIHPFPKLHETLSYLQKQRGYSLILLSNHSWPNNGRRVLQNLKIEYYFDQIIFSGDIGWKKPSSKIFSLAYSKFKDLNKERIIHIGDDYEADIRGAIEFGIKAVWIRSPQHTFKEPKHNLDIEAEIQNINELTNIL